MRTALALSPASKPLWAARALSPWAVGAIMVMSFTATAGQRYDDFDAPLRRMWTLSGDTVLKLPVPRTARVGLGDALSPRDLQPAAWLAKPSLYLGAGNDGIPHRRRDLHFIANTDLQPAQAVVAVSTFRSSVAGTTGRLLTPAEQIPVTPASLTASRPDGSSPVVARATSLSSATPAPVEPEVIAMPELRSMIRSATLTTGPTQGAAVERAAAPQTPRYADLIDPEEMSKEQRCLAEAVYFEARSEPPSGQAAVAQVVLNRVKSGLYPDSVCGVVYQNRHRYLGCQFSFACEGKSLRITEAAPWKQAVRVAREVTFGQTYLPAVGDATHYHAKYVKPYWSRVFSKKDTIGQHIFYKPRPGQT